MAYLAVALCHYLNYMFILDGCHYLNCMFILDGCLLMQTVAK
jgi:hypothetical protein